MIEVTTATEQQQKEVPFPKLMKHKFSDSVVLFEEPKKGTIIIPSPRASGGIGTVCYEWDMAVFEDFEGSLTLTNVRS
jgi:hypothetical protein